MTNVGSAKGDRRLKLYVDGERRDTRGAALEPGVSKRMPFSYPFDELGEFEVSVPPAYAQTISVATAQTPADHTPTPTDGGETAGTPTPTNQNQQTGTSVRSPGFGAVPALAAIGSLLSYFAYARRSDGES